MILLEIPSWILLGRKGAPDGVFSVASAYTLIQGNPDLGADWTWLWKLRLPQKLKAFLWTILHGKLLTNHMRMKRGLTNDPTCPFCCKDEDITHLFRDCYKAKEVWFATFARIWCLDMLRKPWIDWLKSNARNKNHFSKDLSWYTVYCGLMENLEK